MGYFLLCLYLLTKCCIGQRRGNVGDVGCFVNTVIQKSQFILFESSSDTTYNGIYIRNDDIGIINCTDSCEYDSDPYYYGTYIYELYISESITYYMYERATPDYGAIYISQHPCADGTVNSIIFKGEFGDFVGESTGWTSILEEDVREGGGLYFYGWEDNFQDPITVETFCDSSDGVVNSQIGTCTTEAPTNLPTLPPIPEPSFNPTEPSVQPSPQPTVEPTLPSMSPTTAPTGSPTARPTHLPTVSTKEFLAENCDGLSVLYLDNAFPLDESDDKFSIIQNSVYNGRSRWKNNANVEIYYSTRFNNKHWVINNGSYTLIREDPSNSTLPGSGFVSYDHFPNDNIYISSDQQYTLLFECINTSYPTRSPVIEPTYNPTPPEPTNMPLAPTMQPTVACIGLFVQINDINCETQLGFASFQQFSGRYQQQATLFNNHLWWRGVTEGEDVLYYNEVYEKWVLDTPDEYALIEEDDDNSYNERYPPNYGKFILKKSTDNFYPECLVNFTRECYDTGYPTSSPTDSDPTFQVVPQPTAAPTMTPTGVPSQPPTTSPTHTPTQGPTSAPTQLCNGLYVSGAFNETGEYNQADDKLNDRNWWFNVNDDSILFFSESVLHDTWVLFSPSRSEYYLSQNTPPEQPATGLWDYYVGASPFVEETVTLTLECQDNFIPTPLPTITPTVIPTDHPIVTEPPTLAPIDCDFAFISINDTDNLFGGEFFAQDSVSRSDTGKLSWTSRVDDNVGIFYNEPYWYLGSNDTADDTSLIIRYDNYKPPDTGLWQYNEIEIIPQTTEYINDTLTSTQIPELPTETQVVGDLVFVDFDCTTSIEPSTYPSDIPSNQPTGAPTSECLTLQFDTNGEFEYEGNYYKLDLVVNERDSWQSVRLGTMIAYDSDNKWWYVTKSSTIVLVEETVEASLAEFEYFPPSGLYKIYPAGETINVTTTCYAGKLNTTAPTSDPTSYPTLNDAPYWLSCDNNGNNYFDFASDNNEAIAYWDEPQATEDSGGIVTVTNAEGYSPGNTSFTPGHYTITYTATDANGASASEECIINLYVIGGLGTNSYQTCLDNSFSISVTINQSHYVMDTDDIEITDSLTYVGMVSNQELGQDDQNCYVQLVEVRTFEEESNNAGSNGGVTGNLQRFNYWEIIILLVVLWLIVLSIIVARCVYKLRNQKVSPDADKLLGETAAEAGDASIFAGIADHQMMRKATLTGGAVVGGVSQSPVQQAQQPPQNYQLNPGGPGGPGGPGNQNEEMKAGDVELGTITPGGPGGQNGVAIGAAVGVMAQRPSEKLANEKVVVPTNQPYWQRELDVLSAKGYTDESKNLDLLIKNAVKYAGKIDKTETQKKVERMLGELAKSNLAKSGVQKEWDNQEIDQLNAPQATIAPPTMSSLVDSSNVLLEEDDDDILKQIGGFDTRKGSENIPDVGQQGIPPVPPVPPPVGGQGQRPKREDIGNPRESTHLDL